MAGPLHTRPAHWLRKPVRLFYQSLIASQPSVGWRKLPLIIPVVVYDGSEPWNVATDLGSLIGDLDPSSEIYRPQLLYQLVDEAAYILART